MYLTQGLHRARALHPNKRALGTLECHYTYDELSLWVAKLAGALRTLGVEPGDRVSLLAPNSNSYVAWLLACWWTGAVANPLNTRWSAPELTYALADSRPRVLIVDESCAALVSDVSLPGGTRVVWGAAAAAGHVGLAELAETTAAVDDLRVAVEALAAILYTGGTTGFPKGVMLSHSNLWSAAVSRLVTVPTSADSCSLLVAPLFHVAGLGRLIGQLVVGASLLVLGGFRPREVLESLQSGGVTEVLLVPSMIQMLLDEPHFDQYDFAHIKRVIWGAAPIAPARLARALVAFPQAEFVHAYGMTETAAVVAINAEVRRGGARAASVGRPGVGVEARILDGAGQEVARGEVGELAVRGTMVMLGYWNLPDETANALRHGWYLTGDAAVMDEDGYLYVVDRLKDMIVSGGENVYGAEVENILARHGAVARCAVIGVPHERWGEAVHAVIVTRSGAALDEDVLHAHCRQALAAYKCPKSYDFQTELPMSAAGKVLKTVLRERYSKAECLLRADLNTRVIGPNSPESQS